MALCAALLVLAVPLLGGSLGQLSTFRLRWWWLVPAALVVQILVISILPDDRPSLAAAAHDLTYAGLLVVEVANIRRTGMPLLLAGTFTNGLAIAVNGGTLPASTTAVATARVQVHGHGLVNSAPLAHPHLAWLGDIWVSPSWLPLRNVVSVGDLLILLGAAVLVMAHCGALRGWPLRRAAAA